MRKLKRKFNLVPADYFFKQEYDHTYFQESERVVRKSWVDHNY